jgi:hypothetical protein
MNEYSCGVRVDVLGPLRVTDSNGTDVTPDGPLQRKLLALLVLRRGHVVSAMPRSKRSGRRSARVIRSQRCRTTCSACGARCLTA